MRDEIAYISLGATALGLLILAGGTAHAASVTIDFDNQPDGSPLAAPARFADGVPLREQFAAKGVHFEGGGGVLSGSFGVTGTSGPNFLAFNARVSARYSTGEPAAPPEQIRLDQPADLVRLNVASSEGGTATLTALDQGGNTVGSAQLALSATAAPLSVQSTDYNIAAVQLSLAGSRSMVADDLVFVVRDKQNQPPVTHCTLDGPTGANGWYLGDVQATLTAEDPDGSVVATRCRVDGGDWEPYSAPVLVSGEGSHRLEYQSLDNEGAWEAAQTETVKIDLTPPSIDLSVSPSLLRPSEHRMVPVTEVMSRSG